MPAQFVKPYVKSNKNDFIDAEAIAEAVTRENMRFVPISRLKVRFLPRSPFIINNLQGNSRNCGRLPSQLVWHRDDRQGSA